MQFSIQTDINWFLVRDLAIAVFWLFFLAFVNRESQFPIYSIVPYLLPVSILVWRYGLLWGFVFSALAALAAIPGDYMIDHTANNLCWGGLTTYFKLTGFAIGINFSKRLMNDKSKPV